MNYLGMVVLSDTSGIDDNSVPGRTQIALN